MRRFSGMQSRRIDDQAWSERLSVQRFVLKHAGRSSLSRYHASGNIEKKLSLHSRQADDGLTLPVCLQHWSASLRTVTRSSPSLSRKRKRPAKGDRSRSVSYNVTRRPRRNWFCVLVPTSCPNPAREPSLLSCAHALRVQATPYSSSLQDQGASGSAGASSLSPTICSVSCVLSSLASSALFLPDTLLLLLCDVSLIPACFVSSPVPALTTASWVPEAVVPWPKRPSASFSLSGTIMKRSSSIRPAGWPHR